MEIIKYPGQITKKDFLDNYAARLLECMKAGMMSSYDIVLTPEGDSSWYKYLAINLDKGVRYIILEDEYGIRGYLVWNNHGNEIHIYDLVINPKHQCDGSTFRKLLKIFTGDVTYPNYTKLVAYTNFKNDRMNKLLKRHGFSVSKVLTRGTVYTADINELLKKFN